MEIISAFFYSTVRNVPNADNNIIFFLKKYARHLDISTRNKGVGGLPFSLVEDI